MSDETTDLTLAPRQTLTTVDQEMDTIGGIYRIAKAFSSAKLFGFDTPEQAFGLMMICKAEGRNPVDAARRYHIIKGRPSIKAEALLSDYRRAGGRIKIEKFTDAEVSVTFVNPDDTDASDAVTITWNDADVKRAGLATEGSNHLKYPRRMKFHRCISEGIGIRMPELRQGMPVEAELIDDDFDRKPLRQIAPIDDDLTLNDQPTAPEAPAIVVTPLEAKLVQGFARVQSKADHSIYMATRTELETALKEQEGMDNQPLDLEAVARLNTARQEAHKRMVAK